MNKIKKIISLLLLATLLCSCGQKIDEDQVIKNNATANVTAGEDLYELSDQTVTVNGTVLAEHIGANEEKIVVLGNKVYFNTDEGTKYITKNGKIKDFGKGRVIYGKGQWLYYENIGLYRVSVLDGKQSLLSETALEFAEEVDESIIFTDGDNRYVLDPDEDELKPAL